MYYQFTGQPGHGKTVLAIEFAFKLRDGDPPNLFVRLLRWWKKTPPPKKRDLYVCNVKDFNYDATGALPLSPDEVRNWHNDPRFDESILLIDEAYEHDMFPKLSGNNVPAHVQQVAKHRHRGIDFIMVCQSPDKQMHPFLHDLIEEHYHIRRRYGLPFVHVRRFDRFERNPEKAEPLTIVRRAFPKHVFKFYTSTKYDTSEKRIPWFYWAAGGLICFIVLFGTKTCSQVYSRFNPETVKKPVAVDASGVPVSAVSPSGGVMGSNVDLGTPYEYAERHLPRFETMPWTARAYDDRAVTADPLLLCMSSPGGLDAQGEHQPASCTCMTEQGTRYEIPEPSCRRVARHGMPYNPYRQSATAMGGMQGQGAQPAPERVSSSSGYELGERRILGSQGTAGRPTVHPSYGTITRPVP